MKASGSKVVEVKSGFNIVVPGDPKISKWRLYGRTISLSLSNPDHPLYEDTLDMVFNSFDQAAIWFTFLREYVIYDRSESLQFPGAQDILVRRKFYCWMTKTKTTILRCQPVSCVPLHLPRCAELRISQAQNGRYGCAATREVLVYIPHISYTLVPVYFLSPSYTGAVLL